MCSGGVKAHGPMGRAARMGAPQTDPSRPAQPATGHPYPPYDAPFFGDFRDLCERLGDESPDLVAFEQAEGSPVTYRALAQAVEARRRELESAGAGRFVEVRAADPVQFAAHYLACVSSGRAAVLCPLDARQEAVLSAGEVPAEVCALCASSGTSGAPKAVMLTERGILDDLTAGLRLYRFAPGARYAKLLPYTHAFGLVCDLLAPLVTVGTIALPASAATFAAQLPRLGPTALNLPPRAAALLADLLGGTGTAGGYRLPTLRKVLCGGAGLSADTARRLRTHGIEAFGCYGLTECSPCVSVNRDGWRKDGSCGLALDCNEVRVAEQGEVLVRGANVMAGYLGDKERTRQRLCDGWLHTGDVGRIDKDGFLFIDGRLDDLIVLADGTKVAPEPLERELEAHPSVAQALVYGAERDGGRGTVLACKLALRKGTDPDDAADALKFARALRTPEGAPIEQACISDIGLPQGAGGKLLRRAAGR